MKFTYFILIAALVSTDAFTYPLPEQKVKSYECLSCARLAHETLEDRWPINNQALNSTVNNKRTSYSYKKKVSFKELRSGVTLPVLAPGAIVRITPLQKKSMPNLLFKTPENQIMSLKEASALYSEEATLDSDIDSAEQTMLQIKPELGFGTFAIQSESTDADDSDAYLINVFDKFSIVNIQIEADALRYHYGDKLKAIITVNTTDDHLVLEEEELEASLEGPKGEAIPLALTRIKNNKFMATTTLRSEHNDHGENWYIKAIATSTLGKTQLLRTGYSAFSYSIPSASLLSIAQISSKPLTFKAKVNVATGSRYALQSVLFYKNEEGKIKPIETSQAGKWLEPGEQTVEFTFDNSRHLAEDTLFLGYLHLLDYGQIKTVYQYDQPIKLSQLSD